MALNQAQVNKLYNDMLGRNATFGDASEYDADYWVGKTADQVKSGISGSSEFKNRLALVSGAGDAGISEADLDKMVLPGGWKTEHHTDYDSSAGDLFDFNRGNTWMSSTGGGNAWAKEQNAINQVLGATSGNNYSTGVGTESGGGVTDGSTIPVDTGTNTGTNTGNNYLTSADLTSWWDALDKPWLTQADDTTNTSGNDDFMKMMMFMAMMRPQGGGYGGSQYGYGGLNPGGVQSAYNPMDNFQGYMDAFKTLPGISSGTISTGSN
tara:strand:+ start:611 stop:1408 length:798 start_codon:yes stop_codon:yes gene_type:complete